MIYNLYHQLENIRSNHHGKKIVYTSGTFDLTHVGHILFFEDAKKLGDILVVGVANDAAVRDGKPGRPILNEHIRAKTVDSLKPVDYVFVNRTRNLSELDTIFSQLRPDIYAVNEDAFEIDTRRPHTNKYSIDLQILKRWCPESYEGISTSKIIEKVQKLTP